MSIRSMFEQASFAAVFLGAILLSATVPGNAATAVGILKEKGAEIIDLQNEVISFKLLPAESGTCSRFEIKNKSAPFVLRPDTMLLQEVFARQAMETGKPKIPYQYNVAAKGPDRGVIEFITMLNSTNADEAVAGLQLKKRVTLSSNQGCLEIEQTMSNPTSDFLGARIGSRHIFGETGQTVFFIPTERNVLRITGVGSIDNFYQKTSDWDYQPTAGWMAVVNTRNKQGLVFIMDYNFLDAFYTKSSGECGWLMDGGILKPGTAFTTSYLLIPIIGFPGVVYSSRRLIADIEAKPLPDGKLEIIHFLAGSMAPLDKVTVKTSVYGIRSKETMLLSPIILEQTRLEPVDKTIHLNRPPKEPIVIRVEVSGKDWQESYEDYYEGEFKTTIYPGYPYAPEYRRSKPKKN